MSEIVNIIQSFRGEYHFLSNFHRCMVVVPQNQMLFLEHKELVGESAEHVFQALKAWRMKEFNNTLTASSPSESKRRGRRIDLRIGWEDIKVDVMRDVLRSKFSNHDLAVQLQQTAPSILIEGNTWGDTFWGVCNNRGKNWLGLLLMEVRNEL